MGLVDYSDSETSDVEQAPITKAATSTKSKSTFTKVVDRSNPGKIKVSLPQAVAREDQNEDGRPVKRVKTSGGGSFGGFNSFLPPPKRTGQAASSTLGGGQSKSIAVGSRINFKTGAAPAFDRGEEPENAYGAETASNGQSAKDDESNQADDAIKPAEEVKLVGKPLMFRPLSVSRKPAKKKAAIPPKDAAPVPIPQPVTPKEKIAPPPKVCLFSMSTESDSFSQSTVQSASQDYKSLIYDRDDGEDGDTNDLSQEFEPSYEDYTPNASQLSIPPAVPTPPVSQSLSDIAGDLNLSAAERRQLFGRQKTGRAGQSATNIINFNTDQEYLHNEALRASGEQAVHNPVRSIAPGKHSLKQLVNAAQSQREALEESFAKGKSNRAEASSRYGW